MKRELLHAPIGDFADVQLIIGAAVHFVHGHELLQLLAAAPEFPEYLAIQLHLVDFAVVHVGGAGGVGAVEILVLPWRDADGPGSADVYIHGLERAIVVEDLDAAVAAITDVNIALMIDLYRMHVFKLAFTFAAGSPGLEEIAVLVELHDPLVPVSVGYKDIARGIPGHICLAVKGGERSGCESAGTALRAGCWSGSCARGTCGCAACTCTWGRCRGHFRMGQPHDQSAAAHASRGLVFGHRTRNLSEGLGLPAEGHQHFAFGTELDNHVRAFVHHPDIVLRIDADGVREGLGIGARRELAHEVAVLIELVQARRRAAPELARSANGIGQQATARVYEDVSLGIGGHAHRFTQDNIVGVLQKIRSGIKRNFGYGYLRQQRTGKQQRHSH